MQTLACKPVPRRLDAEKPLPPPPLFHDRAPIDQDAERERQLIPIRNNLSKWGMDSAMRPGVARRPTIVYRVFVPQSHSVKMCSPEAINVSSCQARQAPSWHRRLSFRRPQTAVSFRSRSEDIGTRIDQQKRCDAFSPVFPLTMAERRIAAAVPDSASVKRAESEKRRTGSRPSGYQRYFMPYPVTSGRISAKLMSPFRSPRRRRLPSTASTSSSLSFCCCGEQSVDHSVSPLQLYKRESSTFSEPGSAPLTPPFRRSNQTHQFASPHPAAHQLSLVSESSSSLGSDTAEHRLRRLRRVKHQSNLSQSSRSTLQEGSNQASSPMCQSPSDEGTCRFCTPTTPRL